MLKKERVLAYLPLCFMAVAVYSLALFSGFFLRSRAERARAFDPQLQQAEDVAAVLSQGQMPAFLTGGAVPVAIEKSLAPYVLVYKDFGAPIAYGGTLRGMPPKLPQELFIAAKNSGAHRDFWSPQGASRQAVVAVAYAHENDSGFVVAGRSLREDDARARALLRLTFATWFAGIILTALAVLCLAIVPTLSARGNR